MKITRHIIFLGLLLTLLQTACVQKATQTAQALEKDKYPTRLLFLVFDQLRPDLIDRYQLKTFQKIRAEGISFPNAYVGHLGSLTVVSHAVMTSGVLPKRLPWHDDLYKDTTGILGKKGLFYSVVDLKSDQYLKLLKGSESGSLSSSLKNAPFPQPTPSPEVPLRWGPTMAIAQKFYAAHVFGGPATDSIITLGSARKNPPLKGWRAPVGVRLPTFLLEPFGGRYFVDSNNKYGSENTLYPLDGNRYLPAPDAEHTGGDAWVSSATIDYMKENKDWRAIYASFGAIDKILHMLGEHDEETREPWALKAGATLKQTLERADQSLSDLLKYLEESGTLNETLVVITADHGGQFNKFFHGSTVPGKAFFEYGKGENFDEPELLPALRPLLGTGLLRSATCDSMLRFWLNTPDPVLLAKFAKALKAIPGIAEIYIKQVTNKSIHYTRHFRSPELTGPALDWAKAHNQELVETMASPGSPEVLGLLLDQHGYALKGEHGGAQRQVQAIPMILLSPVQRHRNKISEAETRLVDLNPMILKLMNLQIPTGLDGSSAAVDGF